MHNAQARVKCYEANSVSVERLEALKLETAISLRGETEKKKKKFKIRTKTHKCTRGRR